MKLQPYKSQMWLCSNKQTKKNTNKCFSIFLQEYPENLLTSSTNFIYKMWCQINRLNLTWWVSLCPSAAWTCWRFVTVQLESDVLFSPTLCGATLPVLLELSLLCPLPGSPPNRDPCSLACLSWALIISFSLLSWVISASMVSGESSDVIDEEEALGRLQRERLVTLDAELRGWTSLKECEAFTHRWSCWGGAGWVTEEGVEREGVRWHEGKRLKSDLKELGCYREFASSSLSAEEGRAVQQEKQKLDDVEELVRHPVLTDKLFTTSNNKILHYVLQVIPCLYIHHYKFGYCNVLNTRY